jgi:hypothetical protein
VFQPQGWGWGQTVLTSKKIPEMLHRALDFISLAVCGQHGVQWYKGHSEMIVTHLEYRLRDDDSCIVTLQHTPHTAEVNARLPLSDKFMMDAAYQCFG